MPSIFKVDPSDVETFTVVTNPIRTYVSSSVAGVTGSVFLFARRSPFEKDVSPDSSFVESSHDDADLSSLLLAAQQTGKTARSNASLTGSTFTNVLAQYLSGCTAQGQALRLKEILDVQRFSPPPDFNSNTLRKLVIKDTLNPYYRTAYLSAHWAYTNYNTLNFFTASTVPTSSVIMYPNVSAGTNPLAVHAGYCTGTYTPSGSFSFDFYINPRYQQDQRDGSFKAGTIFHLSSTYALSLVSGSSRDVNGRACGFRLQLQLSTSANIPPSWISQDQTGSIHVSGPSGSYTHTAPSLIPSSNLVFLSDDNSLQLNRWHHVVVRWGTETINHGSGTFNIDQVDRGTFVIPSSSITPSLVDVVQLGSASNIYVAIPGVVQLQPDVLCVGNYYEGSNNSSNPQAAFFAKHPATRDGVNTLWSDTGIETPPSYSFSHPLNAEVHDLCIRRCYMSDLDISTSASRGPVALDNTVALYVPPFFVEKSPYRQFVNTHGGILVTPFEEINGATTAPFSVALSFGVGGHYINLENFVKDFGTQQFPLLHHLTGVAIQSTTDLETCNQFLYSQPFVAKRNLTVLPCDDGLFVPSFQFLVSEALQRSIDDLGTENLSFISLDDMVMTSTLLFGPGTLDSGDSASSINDFARQVIGTTPEAPFAAAGPGLTNYSRTVISGSDVEAGAPLTVFQRTQDPSSNEVVVFDISNVFYGFRIHPQSMVLQDSDLLQSSLLGANILSGSNLYVSGALTATTASQGYNSAGPVRITLADDGMGNVYRADCLTSQSTWNSVGNVYYDEGLVVLKSPHVFFFGTSQYSLNLRGEQHVHVMRVNVRAPNNHLNSSSNPNFLSVPINGYPNDAEDDFVYISGINFHDRDLNVVMKTTLAQPIAKRPGDAITFKVKHDF